MRIATANRTAQNKLNEVELLLVTPEELRDYWPIAYVLLEKFDTHMGHLLTRDEVPQMLAAGAMQLWLIGNREGFFFVVLTQVGHYPRGSMMSLFWAEGSRMRDAIPLLAGIEEVAKQHDIAYMRITGRPGWKRMLRSQGYTVWGEALGKVLNEERMN